MDRTERDLRPVPTGTDDASAPVGAVARDVLLDSLAGPDRVDPDAMDLAAMQAEVVALLHRALAAGTAPGLRHPEAHR